MTLNPESRNRQSIRLRNFDYAGNATYFLTLCANGRAHLFGEIEDGFMTLNAIGAMVEREWLRSALLRAELDLHSFVVMPNHLHALVTITPSELLVNEMDALRASGARHAPLPPDSGASRIAPRSLESFVAGFKAATFREVNAPTGSTESLWQRGYYEHVVRDERDFCRIGGYIANNPMNWSFDQENADRTRRDPRAES